MTDFKGPRFDVATALGQGQREIQEDALVVDFPAGMDVGFTVLADGMGGHAAGEIASNIIVTEMFCELKFKMHELQGHESEIPTILYQAALTANDCIRDYVAENPNCYGMGATLIAPVFVENRLYWISVGDSPLWVFRDGRLVQLNEDHSMAPEIDLMVASGLMSEAAGRNHPDRNCLRSCLIGEQIAKIDCPAGAFPAKEDDIFIASSDGLQFLTDDEIVAILDDCRHEAATVIAHRLLAETNALADPDQDNISISVMKPNFVSAAEVAVSVPEEPQVRKDNDSAPTRIVRFGVASNV